MVGDINGDGRVDENDMRALSEGVDNTDGRNDVDEDGKFTSGEPSALSELISGTRTPANKPFWISFDLTKADECYMVLFENKGTAEITVKALPGTLGAIEKEITLRAGAVSAFTFDSRFFKHTKGEHKGKILFSSTGHDLAMRVFEIK